MKPDQLSAHLRLIAGRIDASSRPSRRLVAADLRRIIAAIPTAVPGKGTGLEAFDGISDFEVVEGNRLEGEGGKYAETVEGTTDDGRPFKGVITVLTEPDPMAPLGVRANGWDYEAISGPGA